VAKHAEATYASARVIREDSHVLLAVADDGIGGALGSVESGLGGLIDRIEALDGRLEVISPPGQGTIVRAVIPLHADLPPPPEHGTSEGSAVSPA